MYGRVARQLREHAARRAKRARTQILLLVPLTAAVVFAYSERRALFGLDMPVRIACVLALVILGWSFAMNLGRAVGPTLLRRLDPGTAGTVGFLIRLVTLIVKRHRGAQARRPAPADACGRGRDHRRDPRSRRPADDRQPDRGHRADERPPLPRGRPRSHARGRRGRPGRGAVTSVGLLYVTLANGEDRILVPNSVVLAGAVVPLREPSGVDLRARLPADVRPSEVEERLEEKVSVATRSEPQIDLEEFVDREVVVRIRATPVNREDGAALADKIVSALDEVHTAQNVG
jgi:small conductance mechanosensitive channel